MFSFPFLQKKNTSIPNQYYKLYLQETGRAVWSSRSFEQFADEGYTKNVVAYRCISLIAQSAASIPWKLHSKKVGINDHPLLRLLARPNPCCSGREFFENVYSYRMIGGNSFIMSIKPDQIPTELHVLRPDRIKIIAGKGGIPASYQYTIDKTVRNYPIDRITGRSNILHLKNFHPTNDWYGMSPIEAAAYSIDQHNNASVWNQALLQNGAKPSGALVVKMSDNGSVLTEEQFDRMKKQIDEQYSGAANAGRPLLLEGGMEWKEMSLSPKDMDFIESKHSSARDIALALGVPPQLLGIPGDNTYSNLVEARVALWEQTILPLLDNVINSFNNWLVPSFGKDLTLSYDTDKITALSSRREKLWARLEKADFMTKNEKREAVGLDPIE